MSIHEEYDRVFKALASHIRRQILDDLKDQPLTTGTLCAHFPDLDRCTVMQHLKVLEDAGLVIAERRGRERWNHLDAIPIQDIHDRWIGPHAAAAAAKLARFKQAVETK
jgi:DNA-binding transcriptional ArsR family regulator